MIMSIGSVTLYRNGSSSAHPFGYYTAAMQKFDNSFLESGLEGIQDLLLIGRFGIYYHIGAFSARKADAPTADNQLDRNLDLGHNASLRSHVYRAFSPQTLSQVSQSPGGSASTEGILGVLHD